MRAFCNLIDAFLFLFLFLSVIAFSAPLIDGQVCLPGGIIPEFFVDLRRRYCAEFGDYLFDEKPNFLIGHVWHELLFLWPLSIANVYAILAGEPWFATTRFVYGAALVTSMAAPLGEITGSGKASNKLLMVYLSVTGFGILAILWGLVSHSTKSTGPVSKRPAILARKKRA